MIWLEQGYLNKQSDLCAPGTHLARCQQRGHWARPGPKIFISSTLEISFWNKKKPGHWTCLFLLSHCVMERLAWLRFKISTYTCANSIIGPIFCSDSGPQLCADLVVIFCWCCSRNVDDDDDVGVEVGADVHVDVDVSQHGGLVLVFRGRCRLPVDHVRLPPLYCLYNYSNYKASTTPTSIFRAVSFAGPGKLWGPFPM